MRDLLPMLVGWAIFAVVVLIGATLSVSIVGCDPTTHTTTQKEQTFIHYYKDARTNLCFAGQAGYSYSSTLTYVPCSQEVERLVEPLPEYVGP